MTVETEQNKALILAQKAGLISLKTVTVMFKTALLLLLAASMLWVNYTVDRSGYFYDSSYELLAAQEMLDGLDIEDYDLLNDHNVKSLYAQNRNKPLDVLALGSSRVMQVHKDLVQSDNFFNAGVSGADFKDIVNGYYHYYKAGIIPKTVIIGLDPWVLNSSPDAASIRGDIETYEEFVKECLGSGNTPAPLPVQTSPFAKWEPLFDPAYFQGNIQYLMEGGTVSKSEEISAPPTVQGDILTQTTNVLCSDGSIIYDEAFRNLSPQAVDEKARGEAGTFLRMENFEEFDPERLDIFTRFIHFMQEKGSDIVFLLAPYHPVIYTYALENISRYPGFFLTEPWFAAFAQENNIPLYGSYNPFAVECYEDDFYDGLHMRRETVEVLLPSLPEIVTQKSSGQAGSSWQYRESKVPYTAAEHIVTTFNNMSSPEVLVRSEDTTIDGALAYVLTRYNRAGGTALARYAVTQDQGVFYRYDTSTAAWVHDPRF